MRFLYIYWLIFPAIFLIISNACVAASNPAPDWSYDDDYTGQEDWGAVEEYKSCRLGTNQSPVNISFAKTSNLPPLNFTYNKADGSLNITNKSFIMEVTKGGALIDGKNSYILQTIEIHSPSGHKIKDIFYPLEIHLLHKNSDGDFIIVAVFANIGNANPSIEGILKQASSRNAEIFTVNTTSLFANLNSYYSYKGSLPYPPCAENVQWRIIKTPITISREQLSKITKLIGRNTRLPQPLYMRDVLEN